VSRRLNDLSPAFRPLAIELIARCIEAGVMVMIIDTLRTPAEHAENIRRGVSWTARSKHLSGDAIDLCLYDTYQLHGPDKLQWSTSAAAWQTIGRIGEELGLRWGGRWTVKDMGHFELASAESEERRA
jgi:hypothetical protein